MNFRMIDLENECRKALQYSQVREKTVVGDVIQVFSLLATGEKCSGGQSETEMSHRCHTSANDFCGGGSAQHTREKSLGQVKGIRQ